MSPELIAIITAAIALAGLILATTKRLDTRITRVEAALNARISEMETALGTRLTEVEKESARQNGLFEGLGLAGRLPPTAAVGADRQVRA